MLVTWLWVLKERKNFWLDKGFSLYLKQWGATEILAGKCMLTYFFLKEPFPDTSCWNSSLTPHCMHGLLIFTLTWKIA
jgi:hypothetical protein